MPSVRKNRFNDGKCDRHGRYWSGTVEAAAYTPRGRLFRLDPDLKPKLIMEGITCINGLSFSPDNRLMFHDRLVQLPGSTCSTMTPSTAPSITAASSPKFRSDVVSATARPSMPTGASGARTWHGWCVTRYDPRGRIDMVINLPVRRSEQPVLRRSRSRHPLYHYGAPAHEREGTRAATARGQCARGTSRRERTARAGISRITVWLPGISRRMRIAIY